MTEKLTLRDNAAVRWAALLLLALAMFCSYIFMDILSPIKDLMQSERGWDSLAFGTMQGSETFLNVFVFFLIFAGIILDKMGVRFTALLSGGVMLIGAVIKWYAVAEGFKGSGLEAWFTNNLNYIPGFDELGISPFYQGMPASAKLAAVGFMIFGCGVEMAGITVSRGIVKWFKGREIALAMGSEMALARLGVATCMIFSPFFAKLGGQVDVSRSVAFGVVLLMIALIMFIVYFFMDKKLDAQTGEAEEKDEPFKINFVVGFIVAFIGIFFISFNGQQMHLSPKGDILTMVAAIMWAIYSVVLKKVNALGHTSIQNTKRIFAWGLFFMTLSLPILGFDVSIDEILIPRNLLNLLFLGVIACAGCFVIWNHSCFILGSVRTNQYVYLNPIATIIFSVMILHEKITLCIVLGTILTLSGLIISEYKKES